MEWSLSKTRNRDEVRVELMHHEVSKNDHFWYLGSTIHKKGIVEKDVIHRIKEGWIKWINLIGMLFDIGYLKKKFMGQLYDQPYFMK